MSCQFSIAYTPRLTHDNVKTKTLLDIASCRPQIMADEAFTAWLKEVGAYAVNTALFGVTAWYFYGYNPLEPNPNVRWAINNAAQAGVTVALRMANHARRIGINNPIGVQVWPTEDFDGRQGQPGDNIAPRVYGQEYITIFMRSALSLSALCVLPELRDQSVALFNTVADAATAVINGTNQVAVVTVINHTHYSIIKIESQCYKGSVIADFQYAAPTDSPDGKPETVGVGVWASGSGSFSGAASAIAVRVVGHDRKEYDRVVIASACPISGSNTFLVSTDDNKTVMTLADENDSSGNDYQAPQTVHLEKAKDVRLDVKVEKGETYCYVVATFSQPGLVPVQ